MASWADDTYERDRERDYAKYEREDELPLWEQQWLEAYGQLRLFELAGVLKR